MEQDKFVCCLFFSIHTAIPSLSMIMSRCIVLYCTHQFCRMNHVKLLSGSLTSIGGDSPCTGPQVKVPIQRTAHFFSVIPTNDTKESMFGHQNVSSPAAGIKPDNLAFVASMFANH